MSLEPPSPQDIIVVGASGDLSRRKLLPALYDLSAADLLPRRGSIIGLARRDLDDESFRVLARESIGQFSRTGLDEKLWAGLSSRLMFIHLDEDGYRSLAHDKRQSERLGYLAVPASAVPKIVRDLGGAGLASGTRLLVEKPFGRDLASAKESNSIIHGIFDESQVFRIDHYLAKETVQNIMVFRFGNALFERVWNRDAIDHVQITVAESIGVEGRGAFYEEAGALRDIVQNHVFQVLSLLTMEPPASLTPEAIRDEKAKLFRAMQPLDPVRTGRRHAEKVASFRDQGGAVALVGVADLEPARAARLAKHTGCRAVTEVGELFGAADAAIVAVPTSSHFDVARRALEAGLDVLVEKPIAATLAEAEALVEVAAKRERILQVGHQNSFAIGHCPKDRVS